MISIPMSWAVAGALSMVLLIVLPATIVVACMNIFFLFLVVV